MLKKLIFDKESSKLYCEDTDDAAAQDSKTAILKALLTRTDYEATKYAEGVVTATQYANMKAAREEWRAAIRGIEACTTVDAVNAVTYSTDIPAVD